MVSDDNRLMAVIAGLLILAGPRRTRPIAGFLYGAFLSRVAGAGRNRIMAELLRLFDERQSVGVRVSRVEGHVSVLRDRHRAAQRYARQRHIELADQVASLREEVKTAVADASDALVEAQAAHQFVLRGGEPWTP